jgi:hypothetical protein
MLGHPSNRLHHIYQMTHRRPQPLRAVEQSPLVAGAAGVQLGHQLASAAGRFALDLVEKVGDGGRHTGSAGQRRRRIFLLLLLLIIIIIIIIIIILVIIISTVTTIVIVT